MKWIIYAEYIPKLGGIETFIYQTSKQLILSGEKVSIVYKTLQDPSQALHYGEYADFIQWEVKKQYKADIVVIASNLVLPNNVQGTKYIQVVHSDYQKYNLQLVENQVDKYIAVSKHASSIFEKLYKKEVGVIYNFVDKEYTKGFDKVINLVSTTRLSPEKGIDRMYAMAKALQQNHIKFSWIVYGDNSAFPSELERCRVQFSEFENVHFVGRVNDVRHGLVNAHYLVQLSDFEGCPYSVLEALAFNVPCILTDYKGSEEIVEHGVNGYRLPLDMNISDWSFIYNIPKFINKPLGNIQQWIGLGSNLLNTGKTK